jgi:type IV pilus assembly protein PilY1
VQYACQKNFTLLASDGSWSYNPNDPYDTWETRDIPGLGAASVNYDTDTDLNRHPRPMYGAATPQTYPSLADVAAYYYNPPDYRAANEVFGGLRQSGSVGAKGLDVTNAAVPGAGVGIEDDTNPKQHMATYTLGLGLSGSGRRDLAFHGLYFCVPNKPAGLISSTTVMMTKITVADASG